MPLGRLHHEVCILKVESLREGYVQRSRFNPKLCRCGMELCRSTPKINFSSDSENLQNTESFRREILAVGEYFVNKFIIPNNNLFSMIVIY